MIRFLDGPAEGVALALRSAPERLRVVLNADGRWDALDQPEDEPKPGETVFWYRSEGAAGVVHLLATDPKTRRRRGRWLARAE